MRRDQLEHAIRTACQIIGMPEVIVVGSQSILGTFREDQLPAGRRPPLGCQPPGSFSSVFWLPRQVTHRSGCQPRAETCKKVVRVDLSRQEIVKWLRANGMREVADAAEAELPDPVPPKVADRFCTAHGFSISTLMDRMGASP
jgi:hypothetical protein